MKATDLLSHQLKSTQDMLNMYLGDLSDADILVRPAQSANNIAWQLGHLVSGEPYLMSVFPGATYPELPASFKNQYTKETAAGGPPSGYLKKAEYLDWFNKLRAASIANVEKITDADLDLPNTKVFPEFAPTVAAMGVLVANHTLMHAGQFTVVRRLLGKPVLF